jgi:DNA repair exonuclease SbcCD ATPase subunit
VAYRKELEQIEDEIDYQRRQIQYMREEEDQKKEMEQKRKDAKDLLAAASNMRKAKNHAAQADGGAAPDLRTRGSGTGSLESAEEDWQWLKKNAGVENKTLDELMGMVGLNDVKQEFLSVKNKVDTMLRQKASLASERFNCSMLGNPGTGTFSFRATALLTLRQEKRPLRVSTRSSCARSASSPGTASKRPQDLHLHMGVYPSARH